GAPADIAAGGWKFLDRFPERPRDGADGPLLHVDDQNRRTLANAGRTPEPRSVVGVLLVLRDNVIPGFAHGLLLKHRRDPGRSRSSQVASKAAPPSGDAFPLSHTVDSNTVAAAAGDLCRRHRSVVE